MRHAMATAEVGDDVYGEDPTVLKLQQLAAKAMGKEAAIWVPSGTMGNLSAVLAHCHERGSEAIVGDESHVYQYEAGGMSCLGGVAFNVIPTDLNGELPLEALSAAIRPDDQHCARTALICLENSHNRCGGSVLSLEYMQQVKALADAKGLAVHLDGARVFNAAVALGVHVSAIAHLVTSVQFCLSKGLGAPAGSMVAGPKHFIDRVHRLRKMLGGGMRQVGVLAAPGILALERMSRRLAEDHYNARYLAQELSKTPHVDINLDLVHTNIVVFRLLKSSQLTVEDLVDALQQHGILCLPFRGGVRLVTHNDVSAEDCKQAIVAIRSLLEFARAIKFNGTGNSHANGAVSNEAFALKAYE
ncbi:g4579 [Coccomyxa elongata]